MLTLKELRKGRYLYGRACNDEDFDDTESIRWMESHIEELFVLAERALEFIRSVNQHNEDPQVAEFTTEIEPHTLTVCAFVPMPRYLLKPIVSGLKLYR